MKCIHVTFSFTFMVKHYTAVYKRRAQ